MSDSGDFDKGTAILFVSFNSNGSCGLASYLTNSPCLTVHHIAMDRVKLPHTRA